MTELDLTPDELAGIVGLFGALTRTELRDACLEVAYKRSGERPTAADIDAIIEDAIDEYRLVAREDAGTTHLVSGPTAFPTLPDFADELPHVLDIPDRDIDRRPVALNLIQKLDALDLDPHETDQLSYEIESWANVDASVLREAE